MYVCILQNRNVGFMQNYHNCLTKINFDMLIMVILFEIHTFYFAVYHEPH